jgi:alpha-tubulin suppressor-like RCC1 family protein
MIGTTVRGMALAALAPIALASHGAAASTATALSWGQLLPGAVPVHVKVTIPGIVQVATSASATYALTSGGKVYAWGVGADGALGDGSTADSVATPVLVNLPVPIASLASPAPYKGEIAVGTNGKAYGWGANQYDLLCVTPQNIATPVQLPLSGVTSVSAQGAHALYNEGGTLYECGKGAGGALGNGSNANSSSPVKVSLPGPVSAIVSSWEGSGALVNGTYYDWGYNSVGQLGNGTTQDSNLPVKVNLPAPVAEVFQGGDFGGDGETMALLADGHVYAWGSNTYGELDDGTRTDRALPVKVPLRGASDVACGGSTCYAIRNGLLEGFGNNTYGQLRKDGTAVSYITSTSNNVAVLP